MLLELHHAGRTGDFQRIANRDSPDGCSRGRTSLQRLLEVGSGCAVERIGREVRAAVVGHADLRRSARCRAQSSGRRRARRRSRGPMPPRMTVRSFSCYAKPTRGWMLSVSFGRPARCHGRNSMSFAKMFRPEVVADAEVQRQAVGHPPVVLHPRAELLRRHRDDEVADADHVGPGDRRKRRQVPGVHVERIREHRLQLPRQSAARRRARRSLRRTGGSSPGSDRGRGYSHARCACRAARGVVREGEVVTDAPDALILIARQVLVRCVVEAGELNARRSVGDAVGALPVIRPLRQARVGELEVRSSRPSPR